MSAKGCAIDDGNFRARYWRPLLKKIGIAYRYPYNARHTYISNALAAGASPAQIAAVTRHDLKTMFEKYAHQIGGAEVVDWRAKPDQPSR